MIEMKKKNHHRGSKSDLRNWNKGSVNLKIGQLTPLSLKNRTKSERSLRYLCETTINYNNIRTVGLPEQGQKEYIKQYWIKSSQI